jgi:hypothetical protein
LFLVVGVLPLCIGEHFTKSSTRWVNLGVLTATLFGLCGVEMKAGWLSLRTDVKEPFARRRSALTGAACLGY